MDDLKRRIANLPPEKSRLLAALLAHKGHEVPTGLAPSEPAAASTAAEAPASRQPGAAGSEPPLDPRTEQVRAFYDGINRQLDAGETGRLALFLNYGYAGGDAPAQGRVQLPAYVPNRNSMQLVLEVIGDCPLSGCRVVDVGCGRGGTLSVVALYFDVCELTGLDLSPSAIAFCRSHYDYPHMRFCEGDAASLPFDAASLDVVISIESSHSYTSIPAFYREVWRVLAPGGAFLYADLLRAGAVRGHLRTLAGLGFSLEVDRDITANVLLSCDEVAHRRAQAFGAYQDQALLNQFLAAPGAPVYEEMRSGVLTYRIFRLRKQQVGHE